ncbi:MAG: phytoene/squalene synthase family protein [Myxococcota bacterium]
MNANTWAEQHALAPREAGADADLRHCTQLLQAGSRSFWAASHLLPSRIRPDVTAFYAFCRVADDAIDEGEDPGAALANLHERVERIYQGRPVDDPVDRAFARVVFDNRIPAALVEALLDGFAWDLEDRRYDTLDETLGYAARVASTVGAVMTLIMGVDDRDALSRACDLGAAMQLTNIARDVGEDARMGRLYLPADWLRREGVDPQQWLHAPTPSLGIRRATARLLAHADRLYARANAGIPALPRDCQPAIRAASTIYADIGRVIARRGFDSVTRRARTSGWRKLWRLAQAWTRRLAPQPELLAVAPEPALAFIVETVRPRALCPAPGVSP